MTPFSPARPLRAETRFSSSAVLSRPSPCTVPPVIERPWQLGVGRWKGIRFSHRASLRPSPRNGAS